MDQDASESIDFSNGPVLNDREKAGEMLSLKLKKLSLKNPIVIAIPRGGVVTGAVIAKRLRCELDIIAPRKLHDPYEEELAIGAIMPDGTAFINDSVVAARGVSGEYIESEKKMQIRESARRMKEYRGDKPYPELKGRSVILVDDGIATGATMTLAARWARARDPHELVIAVPVLPRDMLDALSVEVDRIVYLSAPIFFEGIGQFYRNFEQVDDKEVISLLKKARSEGR